MMDERTWPLLRQETDEQATRMRLDQHPQGVCLRFGGPNEAWELFIPDEQIEFTHIRLTIREIGSLRGAEASALVAWDDFVTARNWLRCLPDGYPLSNEVEPALIIIRTTFAPLVTALSL